MLAAVGFSLASLNSILLDIGWWFVTMTVATIVMVSGAVVRSFARNRLWGTLASLVGAVSSITLLFSPGDAFLGIIPTFETFDSFHELELAGADSIASQAVPAEADQGVVFLLCIGVAALAFAMELFAFAARVPALTGFALLLLLLVPSLVDPLLADGFFFALTAACYLGILLVRGRPGGRRAAVGIGAIAVLAALVVPLALPPVDPSLALEEGGPNGAATGINPILSLGEDLRRGDPSLAFTYTTTAAAGEYFRLTVLDDFSGIAWEPSNTAVDPGNDLAEIGPPLGLGPSIPVSEVTSEVTIANILSRWLPAPYAPTSVTGVEGTWGWEPDGLAIRTERANARGQSYSVTSIDIAPSIEQLIAAGTTVEPGLGRYLAVPGDLPEVVGATAAAVVGDAATFYDQALALQEFFRGGAFSYSEDAPVEQGYDGSGASVLAAFLEAKSGYCVHFSSAMASMARTLGIPARVAVGFTPGDPVIEDGVNVYRVTTHNFHAWPELFFSGIGWVRFEPTPGRGTPPAFAPLVADDPATPDVDESQPVPPDSAAAPTAAPTGTAVPTDAPSPTPIPGAEGATAATSSPLSLILGVLGLLLLAPMVVRLVRRERRLVLVARGSGAAAWAELRDRVHDLGWRTTVSRTPRQFSADLAARLDDDGAAALSRLRAALESEAFAEKPGSPDPHDVRVVSRSLGRKAGVGARVLALVLPRSLVGAWLPEPSSSVA
jgi:transglutaminase-like putative cysteine protease